MVPDRAWASLFEPMIYPVLPGEVEIPMPAFQVEGYKKRAHSEPLGFGFSFRWSDLIGVENAVS